MLSFQQFLLSWYEKNARKLPWRATRNPYLIWISEVMLQQTTVNAVIPFYRRWIKIFPRIEDVARVSLPRVLKMWQGLGYYQRARNIHKTARILCRDYEGRIPQDAAVLRILPGFGPYTTGAVLSIAFNQRWPVLDANVRRVMIRLLALKGETNVKTDKLILGFLKGILPNHDVSHFNQALMELGALICQPQEPLCMSCPVTKWCKAFKKGWQDSIPVSTHKATKNIEAVCAIMEQEGKFFLQKRPAHGLLAGLWEFPGGKIKAGERSQEALRRELKEELGVRLLSASPFMDFRHAYTQFNVNLHAWHCKVKPLPLQNATHRWVTPREFKRFPMPSATVRIVERIMKDST